MNKTTKIALAASIALLVAVGYFASTTHVFRGCDLTETMTAFKVKESFKAPFYKYKLDVGRYQQQMKELSHLLQIRALKDGKAHT